MTILLRRFNRQFAEVEHFPVCVIPVFALVGHFNFCANSIIRSRFFPCARSMLSNTKLKRATRLRALNGGAADAQTIRSEHSGARPKSRAGWKPTAPEISDDSASGLKEERALLQGAMLVEREILGSAWQHQVPERPT